MISHSVTEKYTQLLDLLHFWQLKQADLENVIRGRKSLTREAMLSWGQASFSFNQESYETIKGSTKEADGFKIILSEVSPQKNLSVIRRALLYTDLIVIYSGSPLVIKFSDDLMVGLRKGGVICDGVVEWFRDLLFFEPLFRSGYGVCVQKHYYDMSPQLDAPRWILSDLPNRGDRTRQLETDSNIINPFSLYFDLVSPSAFGCAFSGASFSEWKGKLVSQFKGLNDASFGALLSFDLPYLDNLPLNLLVRIRADEPEAFVNFRKALLAAVRECLKFDVTQETIQDLSKHIYETYIEPQVEDVKNKLQKTAKMNAVRRSGAAIKFLSLGFNALLGNPIGLLIDSLTIGQTTVQEILQVKQEKQSGRTNEMYLLWKLKQVSER